MTCFDNIARLGRAQLVGAAYLIGLGMVFPWQARRAPPTAATPSAQPPTAGSGRHVRRRARAVLSASVRMGPLWRAPSWRHAGGMRLWSLHPTLLDRAALVAGWREGLLAQAVLAGRTRGYRSHPQLGRFQETADPVQAVVTYLTALHEEATRRGYRFDATRLDGEPDPTLRLTVTSGQLEYELRHLRAKVQGRSPEWEPTLTGPVPHPMFDVVEGPVEPWERVSPGRGPSTDHGG